MKSSPIEQVNQKPSSLPKISISKLVKWLETASFDDYLKHFADHMERYLMDCTRNPDVDAHTQAKIRRRIDDTRLARLDHLKTGSYLGYIGTFAHQCRLQPFIQVQKQLSDNEYWQTLRDVWLESDITLGSFDTWLTLFQADRKQRKKLMNVEETKVLENLPNHFLIYRGYGIRKERAYYSLSWTLDKDIAEWFSGQDQMRRKSAEKGRIVVGSCSKADVLAYFEREQEIVIDPGRVRKSEMAESNCLQRN